TKKFAARGGSPRGRSPQGRLRLLLIERIISNVERLTLVQRGGYVTSAQTAVPSMRRSGEVSTCALDRTPSGQGVAHRSISVGGTSRRIATSDQSMRSPCRSRRNPRLSFRISAARRSLQIFGRVCAARGHSGKHVHFPAGFGPAIAAGLDQGSGQDSVSLASE